MTDASGTITSMTDRSPRTAPQPHHIESGDMLAKSGEWAIAIDAWQQAVVDDPRQLGRVEQRLNWFLGEIQQEGPRLPGRIATCIGGCAGTALVGVGCIQYADTPGTLTASALAVTAWLMFIMSAVMAVVAAHGDTPRDYQELLRLARTHASRLTSSQHSEDC